MAAMSSQAKFLKQTIYILAIVSAFGLSGVNSNPISYRAQREALIQAEQALRIGGTGSDLTADEQKINKILLREKNQIIEAARFNGSDFPVRHSFFNVTAKAAMENTTAFRIIRKMPKGGLLHTHIEATTSIDWVIKNVTYRDNCYMCVKENYDVKFHFFSTPPAEEDCQWKLIRQFRAESGNPEAFDRSLHNNISLVRPDYATAYTNINVVWNRFEQFFDKVESLIFYAPVFEDFMREGLRQILEDNVQYVEMRALVASLYELDGSTHDAAWTLALYRRIFSSFKRQNPDFIGGKIIKYNVKFQPLEKIEERVKETMQLFLDNPDVLAGYDLVGQEDSLQPLRFYLDALLYPSRQNPPVHLPYFFHAGETNWLETASDYNLVDALLLNTSRIGHGFALSKHPMLMQMVKERCLAIEVNPISNQLLKLVDDLRTHPAAGWIAGGLPVIISSDDNAVWEALPLTHDFYVTFMALTGEDAGLATLKGLALNSLKYSTLTDTQKQDAIRAWENKWNAFISEMVTELAA